jgi:hypothetical protein
MIIDFPGWNSRPFGIGMSSNCEIVGVRGVEDAHPATTARTHNTTPTRAASGKRVFSMGGSYQPPWRRAKQFIALALILALVLPGCASRNVPPMGLGGKLFRPESDEGKLWSLADRDERAAELDPKYPDPFRQLGLLYHQQKDAARARAAFEKYLALRPDAPDARQIKGYLVELDR